MRRSNSTSSISCLQSSCIVWKLSWGVCVKDECTIASSATSITSKPGRWCGSDFQQALKTNALLKAKDNNHLLDNCLFSYQFGKNNFIIIAEKPYLPWGLATAGDRYLVSGEWVCWQRRHMQQLTCRFPCKAFLRLEAPKGGLRMTIRR